MELAPNHVGFAENNQLWVEKAPGSRKIPASLGETPEGDASFARQK
jgi:hypothetical protein